jgi:hypothetical protein
MTSGANAPTTTVSSTLSRRTAWAVGLGLAVVAAVVRMAMWRTARFGGDEALFFQMGVDIVDGRHWPLLGTQITDGAARLPGPTFLYVMALPLLVWRAPEAQYLFVELLGALTVVLGWQALRRPFGERGALAAGLLVACSPWSALYADRTWNPNVLPFVVALAFLAMVRLREHPSSRWGIALGPLLAVMPHFHMAAPVAWAGLLALGGRSLLRIPRRHLAWATAGALVCCVPMLVHEWQTGFQNTRLILLETIGRKGGERHPWGFVFVPVYALRFLTLDVSYHELTGYWGGPDELRNVQALWQGSQARPFHPLRALALAASFAVAFAALLSAVRDTWRANRLGPFGRAFVVALLANTLLMAATAKQVFGHYVTCLYPFVVVAWAALFAKRKQSADVPAVYLRRRVFSATLCTAAFVVGAGGVEATWSVSRNVDAKIGLGVYRCVGETLVTTISVEHAPQTEPVHLTFRGVHGSRYAWQIFLRSALSSSVRMSDQESPFSFALVPTGAPRPHRATGDAIDCGASTLWRLR